MSCWKQAWGASAFGMLLALTSAGIAHGDTLTLSTSTVAPTPPSTLASLLHFVSTQPGANYRCTTLQQLGTDISQDLGCQLMLLWHPPASPQNSIASLIAQLNGNPAPTQSSPTPDQQSSYPTTQNPPQNSMVNGYDIYSPEPLMVGGALKLYFGGWYASSDLPHDSIFVADCQGTLGPCDNVRKVVSSVAAGLYQVNDPSIVFHSAIPPATGYYIMYMTGSTGTDIGSNNIYYSTSWGNDGVNWSKPALLVKGYWLPSVTMKDGGTVVLYANSTSDGVVRMFDLGPSGLTVGKPTSLIFDNTADVPPYYSNVNVEWRPTINMYQMLAERALSTAAGAPSVIDYLSSSDGVHWHLQYPGVIQATDDQYRVGTPAQNPDSAFVVYFGSTAAQNSMGFHVNVAQWSAPN